MTKRILVIDDEDQFRLMLRHMLEKEGYEILEAANGKEAVKMLRTAIPDLVITDILMPEMDGIEIILQLHREYPQLKIFAISGGGGVYPEQYLQAAKTFGAIKIFEKPFERAELLAAIKDHLDS